MNSRRSSETLLPIDVLSAEISPCAHLVQFYQHDDALLDTLEGFVAGGLNAGDGVIIIATLAHRTALEKRLSGRGINIESARISDQFIVADAEQTLERFMVNGWPDEKKFEEVVNELISRARGRQWNEPRARIRAFGEMVAIMWGKGMNAATLRLEQLWHNVCREKAFSLFCAYPKVIFDGNARESIDQISAAHSRVVAN